MFFKRFFYYLNPATLFHKGEKKNLSLRAMHGINRISIFLFLLCLLVMLVKWVGVI